MSESRSKEPARGQPKIKRFGQGIYAKWSATREEWVYYVQYWWQPPDELRRKRISEQVPRDNDGKCRLKTARKIAAQRDRDRLRPDFTPPHLKKRREHEQRRREAEERQPLLFELASERFLTECASEYASPKAIRAAFKRLNLAFAGSYLDQITRTDVRQYFVDRLSNTGPFARWPRNVSRRVPEIEIAAMSALYTHVEATGCRLVNPCHRPRVRRKDGLLAPYRPRHETPIPTKLELATILDTRRTGRDGRDLITDEHRALLALTFYTAARPESEPCRLLHGDVEVGDDHSWGCVTYRATKTGGDRRIPLHPEASRVVRSILRPVPIDKAMREEWARTPVFRKARGRLKGGRGEEEVPWDRDSYSKAWANVMAVVGLKSPSLAGLWLRDLRKVARTYMVEARVHPDVIRKIMGHADRKSEDRYFVPTDRELQKGLAALGLDAARDAGQEGQTVQSVSRLGDESAK